MGRREPQEGAIVSEGPCLVSDRWSGSYRKGSMVVGTSAFRASILVVCYLDLCLLCIREVLTHKVKTSDISQVSLLQDVTGTLPAVHVHTTEVGMTA